MSNSGPSRSKPTLVDDSQCQSAQCATFVLSLDFELAWGMRDLLGDGAQQRECMMTREVVVPELLKLFERYDVPASWCTVGQLFDSEIPDPAPKYFEQFKAPSHAWMQRPWFDGVPSGTEDEIPDYLCPSILRDIQKVRPRQEIGSHGFSHAIFGDAGCGRECAESELQASIDRAEKIGVRMTSMVFPRNRCGHRDLLKSHGFLCYRGEGRSILPRHWPHSAHKLAHLVAVFTQRFVYPVSPKKDEYGLWDIPSSMMLFPAHGLRKYVPMSFRVNRAKRGLDAAVRENKVFHLWFHPINLAYETERLLGAMEEILQYAASLREQGKLKFRSMGDLARECERSSPDTNLSSELGAEAS